MMQINSKEILAKVSSLKDNVKALMVALAVIFLLDMVVLVGFQFMPLTRMWSKSHKIKSDINQANIDLKSSASLKGRLNDLKTELSNLNKKAIVEQDLPQVLETISKFATVSTVKILKIRPMSEVRNIQKPVVISSEEELIREKISVSAIASFYQLGRFVALLENSSVFFDIRKLEIRTDSVEPMKHSITIFLDVVLRKS